MDINLENINYIKFTFTDKENIKHSLKAGIKYISDYEIHAVIKPEGKLFINTPQETKLDFICDNGKFETKSKLKYTKKQDEFLLLIFETPKDLVYKQDRGYFRVKLDNSAILTYEHNNEIKRVPAKIHDISASGVRVDIKISVYIPDEVAINLLLDEKEVKTKAKFIRAETEHNAVSVAFQFTDLSEANQDYISKICIKKQLEEKRKNRLS